MLLPGIATGLAGAEAAAALAGNRCLLRTILLTLVTTAIDSVLVSLLSLISGLTGHVDSPPFGLTSEQHDTSRVHASYSFLYYRTILYGFPARIRTPNNWTRTSCVANYTTGKWSR